jgi:hypothetical protein
MRVSWVLGSLRDPLRGFLKTRISDPSGFIRILYENP